MNVSLKHLFVSFPGVFLKYLNFLGAIFEFIAVNVTLDGDNFNSSDVILGPYYVKSDTRSQMENCQLTIHFFGEFSCLSPEFDISIYKNAFMYTQTVFIYFSKQ